VLVPVPFVGRMEMTVVEVVDVVTMRHGCVAASGAVLVGVFGVFHA